MSEAKQATSKQSALSAIGSFPEKTSSGRVGSATARKSKESKLPKKLASAGKSMSRMKFRKLSYGFGAVAGIRMMSRSSMGRDVEYKRPPLLFLPTYQLEPVVRFHAPSATKIANEVIKDFFLDHKYNVQESPALAMRISYEVMRRIRSLGFNRYRIISVVTIGQKRSQCYNNAIAFLWDSERDNYINAHSEVTTAFLQITVFGVYLD